MRRKAAVKKGKALTNDFDAYPVFGDPVALKKVVDRIASDPKKARKFLLEVGIITKDGKLSPNYGGSK